MSNNYRVHQWLHVCIRIADSMALDAACNAEKKLFRAGFDTRIPEVYSSVVREYVQASARHAWEKEFLASIEQYGQNVSNYPRLDLWRTILRGDDIHNRYNEGLVSLEEYARHLSREALLHPESE